MINLANYVPANSLQYCIDLWHMHRFQLKITHSRKTKLGDYRYFHREKRHLITLNNDLNIYSFLITYLHELAHLVVKESYRRRFPPHGKQWKLAFIHLMNPVLNNQVFPDDILSPLKDYMENPMASTNSHMPLLLALKNYDHRDDDATFLYEIERDINFSLNGRIFKKLTDKRTRVLCQDLRNGKKYLISKMAEVKPMV